MFEVNWTGSWPCLCSGKWVILKDGVNVSDAIPEEKLHSPMGTFGTYNSWHFEEDWEEKWECYKDGLDRQDWIIANPWINAICDTDEEKNQLYWAIANCDWRYGSCGGCI